MIIDNYPDPTEKQIFVLVCPGCEGRNIVKIPKHFLDRQENGGTLETFYCDCGYYNRIVKKITVELI